MTRAEARNEINSRKLTEYIRLTLSAKAGKGMYVCPICHSGEGRNGTGALGIDKTTNRVTCFSKGCFGNASANALGTDTLGALCIIWNCGENEVFKRLGYSIDKDITEPKIRQMKRANEPPKPIPVPEDYSVLYKQWHQNLKESPEALEYLHGRGITDASIERFYLGYCATWKHSKAGERVQPSRRIIIPRTKGTYTARRIDPPANDIEEKYKKQIQGSQKDLFNLAALNGAETPIICEGELDAISLYQAGAAAVVGIGSIINTGSILAEAKKHPEAVFILALDNDPVKEDGSIPGKDKQNELETEMKAAGLDVVNIDPEKIYHGAKDANELLVKDHSQLEKSVRELEEIAIIIKNSRDAERAEELKKRTGEGMLEDFLLTVQNSEERTFEPISTGIDGIDKALEGGFIRKSLVTLGAPPAMGKTALAQWMLENMACGGYDVLYINLEMSREQLLARSISRLAKKYNNKSYSALDILRGYNWTDEDRSIILKAAERYKKEIAPHFIYNPDGVTNHIDSILSAIEAETARIKAGGNPAPIVCIDYLQLIDSGEKDAVEGLKGVIFKLKDYAIREKTVVLTIIANNRASNKTGTVDMESGRDTSAIEYSGDFMLGLAYTAIEEHRKYQIGTDKTGKPIEAEYDLEEIRRLKREAYEKNEEIPRVCKEYSLKIMKSRYTENERSVKLIFDGKHSSFEENKAAGLEEVNGTLDDFLK